MIFLNLKIDNICMFKDTFIDFTYPKKITDSTIEGEFLIDFPNIKYKKVCILMGANASGKTTLGRVMCAINNYLSGSPLDHVEEVMHDKTKNAYIEVTYITPDTRQIHALKVVFNQDGLISESYRVNELRVSKSLHKTLSDLNNSEPEFLFEPGKNNHGIENPGFTSIAKLTGITIDTEKTGWHYLYSDFQTSSNDFKHNDIKLLEVILKVFDTSISKINSMKVEGVYAIKFKNGDDVVVDNGEILNDSRLSRGTIESIEVAGFIGAIIQLQAKDKSSTYFLDEKMAYSHSEIEIAMLNLMIGKLNNQSQLFYTTHNYDILEMNLPSHCYIFMKKEDFVTVSHPEKMGYTKNDRSLLGYVKNDVFNTLPDTSKIDELL